MFMRKWSQIVKAVQHGFSLVELMVVIAIIGILAAIAVPMYQNQTVRADWADAISAVSGYTNALSQCLLQNNGVYNGKCDDKALVGAVLPGKVGNGNVTPSQNKLTTAVSWATRAGAGSAATKSTAPIVLTGSGTNNSNCGLVFVHNNAETQGYFKWTIGHIELVKSNNDCTSQTSYPVTSASAS